MSVWGSSTDQANKPTTRKYPSLVGLKAAVREAGSVDEYVNQIKPAELVCYCTRGGLDVDKTVDCAAAIEQSLINDADKAGTYWHNQKGADLAKHRELIDTLL